MGVARAILLSATTLVVFDSPVFADDEYLPPQVGTMVTWSFGTEDERETRISEVVATGSDFAIYLSDLRMDDKQPSSYFVEFSGIHIASCADDLPTADQRARLAETWPLTTGDMVDVEGAFTATYTIGEVESYTLNAAEGPSDARHISADYGSVENDITFSLVWNMPVAISWPDGTGDKALEVLPPADSSQSLENLRESLGNCAALLDK